MPEKKPTWIDSSSTRKANPMRMFSFPRVLTMALVALAIVMQPSGSTLAGGPSLSDEPITSAGDSSAIHVYVPNQMGASISVLNAAGEVVTTVDLTEFGFSEHAMPHQVTPSPDGTAWYVTLAGDNYVAKFDSDNRLVAKTRFEAPGMIQLDLARDRLYVSRALGALRPPSSLGVFRASDMKRLEDAYIFISRPHALTVDTTRGVVYSASLSGDQIATLDTQTGTVEVTNIDEAPAGFVGLAVSPDGNRLVATTQTTNLLLAFDASTPADLVKMASIPVDPLPYDVVFSPDGRSVWFPNQRADRVTHVETEQWTVVAVIASEAFQEPHGVAVSPDSRTVYVSSHGKILGDRPKAKRGDLDTESARANGTLAVIDASRGTVRSVLEVGPYAAAVGICLIP